MQIHSNVYSHFYETFQEKLFKNEFKPEVDEGRSINDIWGKKAVDEKSKLKAISFITDRFGVKPKYFYEKYLEVKRRRKKKPNEVFEIPFADFAFVRACEYIKDVSEKNRYIGNEYDVQAERLKEEYVSEYLPHIKEDSAPPVDQNKINPDFAQQQSTAIEICENLLCEYYEAITSKNFLQGWVLLTPEYQRESGFVDFNTFSLYYEPTIDIQFEILYHEYRSYTNGNNPKIKLCINYSEARLKYGLFQIVLHTQDARNKSKKMGKKNPYYFEREKEVAPYFYLARFIEGLFPNLFPQPGKNTKTFFDLDQLTLFSPDFQFELFAHREVLDAAEEILPKSQFIINRYEQIVEFDSLHGRWLINNISDFLLKRFDENLFVS
ncbi:MAG: hypothetical protein J7621_23360 [Niastella sp.]|nr:hypothetical protein [Niastella sp.]